MEGGVDDTRLDVFLSYSRKDTERARFLADVLNSKGMTVWFDSSFILPGESWQSKIVENLNRARYVVVLWSQSSIDSRIVLDEAHRAYDARKLLPVLLDGFPVAQLPPPFNLVNSINWQTSDDVREIVTAIENAKKRTGDPSDRPLIGTKKVTAEKPEYTRQKRASRTRIFIAHASNDKPALSGPIAALVEMGFQVWIDKPEELRVAPHILKQIGTARIHYGEDWRERIFRAVKRADRVLGCWSMDAIRGRREQFYYEIYLGLVRQKLVQCRIDPVPYDEIGMPYTFSHIADLSGFESGEFSLPLNQLMEDLAAPKPWFGRLDLLQ